MPKRGPTFGADGTPLVADLERAADVLKVPVGRLIEAVTAARLEPWGGPGQHASGCDVFRWRELVAAAHAAGSPPPALITMPGGSTGTEAASGNGSRPASERGSRGGSHAQGRLDR
jgi:hypothetical protein